MNGSAEDVVARDATSLLTELTQSQSTEHTESTDDLEAGAGRKFSERRDPPAPDPHLWSNGVPFTPAYYSTRTIRKFIRSDDPLGLKNTTLKKNI